MEWPLSFPVIWCFILGVYERTGVVLCKRENPRKNDAMPATRQRDFVTQNTKIFLNIIVTK